MKFTRASSVAAARALALSLALVIALPLTSCSVSSSGGARQSSDTGPISGFQTLDSAFQSDGSAGALAESVAPAESSAEASAERSIIKNGTLELVVPSTSDATAEVTAVAVSLGGTVLSQQVWESGGSTQSGSLLVSVPTAQFDAAFTELGKIGEVRGEHRSSEDVTAQHVDLAARVAALEVSVDRLLELMQGATSTSDLLEIETTLSARQGELDGLKAQLKSLEGLIADARIIVNVSETSVLPGGGPKSFWEAITIGVASLGAFASSAVIVLGVALPWLVIAGLIAAAIIIPVRRRRKSRTQVPGQEAGPTRDEHPNSADFVEETGDRS